MPELRWTLLLLGALFIAVLAWWERRKPRQSAGAGREPTVSEAPPPRVLREPTLTLPEIRARDPSPPQDLPVVQIPPDGFLADFRVDDRLLEDEAVMQTAELKTPEQQATTLPVLEAAPHAGTPSEAASSSAGSGAAPPPLPGIPDADAPIVNWPPEEERRILALRIVSVSPERFAGRAIRTALVAEGFVLGRFSIFHKPDADRRAVLSAASLSKPGIFDLETIDSQRFSGLNVFAILPGPRQPREAFEELLASARSLNERLQGGLQDDRGGPLTPTRIASLREGLEGSSAREPDSAP